MEIVWSFSERRCRFESKRGCLGSPASCFQFGLGGRVGSGEQWMSWIELSDLVEIIIWAIEGDYEGSLNAVSPNPSY